MRFQLPPKMLLFWGWDCLSLSLSLFNSLCHSEWLSFIHLLIRLMAFERGSMKRKTFGFPGKSNSVMLVLYKNRMTLKQCSGLYGVGGYELFIALFNLLPGEG